MGHRSKDCQNKMKCEDCFRYPTKRLKGLKKNLDTKEYCEQYREFLEGLLKKEKVATEGKKCAGRRFCFNYY